LVAREVAQRVRPKLLHGFVHADFAQIARGFGWDAHRVARTEDLKPAFAQAAASRRATLIDVVIDPSEYDAQILALRG
jgi:acetolactate synthase-1/2/3 large subunit